MTVRPVQLHWQKLLPTRNLTAAWAILSDTDRFNRAANLGFEFEEEVDDGGRRIKVGKVRRMGMELVWEDDPFTYLAPRQLVSVRRFRTGPLKRLETTIRLQEASDGIVLDYTIRLVARSYLVRPLVQIDAAMSIKPSIGKVLDAAASQLGDAPKSYAAPPPLSEEALQRLERLRDLASGPDLEQAIRSADLREQDRLRPRALARRWGRDAGDVLRDMITAVDRGVLELRFDLLCPRCQGASQRRLILDVRPTDLHCESCGIAYDGSFPDSVEVSFRPAPAVRTFELPLDCANSPTHAPQRLAREDLPAGGELIWELDLEPGAYRIELAHDRGASLGGASLEVRPGLRDHHAAIDAEPHGPNPAILRVGPGRVTLAIRSRRDEITSVSLDRRWRPEDALTAGQLLEDEAARALLPDGVVPASLALTTRRAAVLVIDGSLAPGQVERAQRRLTHGNRATGGPVSPETTHLADNCLIAVYPRFEDALAAARTLVPSPRLSLLVDHGALTLVKDRQGVIPHGRVVERATDSARKLGVGRLGVPADTAAEPDVKQALQRSGMPVRKTEDLPVVWLETPPAPPNPDASLPSAFAERYVLGDELARGGMGVVHLGRDASTGQEIVIKVLAPELSSDPSYAQRFFWEARVTKALSHPHTVRLYDYGADGPYVWMVMERLHGEDLWERLVRTGALGPVEAARLGAQALEGLAAAHAQSIVHRDVKPANLFVCNEPVAETVKVLDFGIAVSVYDDLADEGTTVPGTPKYLAPEQVERRVIDGRADVYAMGLVLYHGLCGQLPFQATGSRAMALIRLAVDPRPLRDIAPRVPAALADILMKAIAREPEDRWPDARSMAAALRAFAESQEEDAA